MTLADAIIEERVDDVIQRLRYQEDINVLDEYGFTPLIEAAIADNIEIGKILINYGADVNLQDATGGTALQWTAENNNMSFTRLLLDKGANPNGYTFAGQPVLVMPLLRGQTELKNLLLQYGARLDFTQDYINAKLLGHIFELVGTADIVDTQNNYVELDFEGFYLEFSLAIIAESVAQFRGHFAARHLRQYQQHSQIIVDVISRAARLATYQQYRIDINNHRDAIDTLLQQEPLIMPVGYEGHAITFIKAGPILVKCDRREDSRLYDNVMFYRITQPQHLTLDFIKEIIFVKQSSDFINVDLPAFLGLEPITELKVPAQISGNCSWANVEACIPALLFLMFTQAKDFKEQISRYKNMALNFFNQWREWNKTRSLNFCIQSFHHSDALRKACKAEILAAILFQCCRDQNPLDKERSNEILEILSLPAYRYVLENYIKSYVYEDQSEEGRAFMRKMKELNFI